MSEGFTPSQLDKRDIDRLRSYRALLHFYQGQHWEGYARWGETRLTFNYAKLIIDKITSYLMSGITFAVDPVADSVEAKASARRAEQALYRVYEDSNLAQLDFETEIDCAILGDGCFKVIWDAEAKRVRVTAPDIQGIYAWWLGDDTSRVWRVASKYNLTSEEATFRYQVKTKGKVASLTLYALDGWDLTRNWRARHQFRWNKITSEMSVRDMLAFVLGRCGLKLEIKSQPSVLDSYYPDFSIQPDSQGYAVIRRLLSFVPGVVFIEADKAYVANPTATDSSSYSYGLDHLIMEGRYRRGAWEPNRLQVEGYDPAGEEAIIVDSFSWSEINRLGDRLERLEDRNIASVSQAGQRGEAYLRHAEIAATGGEIRIPPNCGQQLYDVIDITDPRAGLSSAKKRVVGVTLTYRPRRGEYEERLLLGAV